MSLDTSSIDEIPTGNSSDSAQEQELTDDVQENQIHKQKLEINYLKAQIDKIEAQTLDTKTLTDLKSSYAGYIMFFLGIWFGALVLAMLTYFTYQMHLEKEIPKEVIISIFTCTAVIAGLAGYVVKGLFGGNGETK